MRHSIALAITLGLTIIAIAGCAVNIHAKGKGEYMFADAIEQVRKSIFPVFWKQKEGSKVHLGIAGTGFFISKDGLFATACHVIDNVPPDATIFAAGNVPYEAKPEEIIEEVARDEPADVFIGRVVTNKQNPLRLAKSRARIGSFVCVSGYPLARMEEMPQGGVNVRNVRQFHQQSMVLDYFNMRTPFNGQRVQTIRQYESFWITNAALPGMSGGPVFGTDGVVYGIHVATGTRRIPADANRDEIVVNCGIAVHVEYVSRLLKAINKN